MCLFGVTRPASCVLGPLVALCLVGCPDGDPGHDAKVDFVGLNDAVSEASDNNRTIYLTNGTLRIGVDMYWGGMIREIWYKGENLINNHDGGRLLGISLYDGSSPTGLDPGDPTWGWNPTPSDKYDHENTPLSHSTNSGVFTVKTRNLQWNPDNKGGGPDKAIASDVVVETRISFLPAHPTAFRVNYEIEHTGADSHSVHTQEAPFAYVRKQRNRMVLYGGTKPWQDDAVTTAAPPTFPPLTITPSLERWIALVDATDVGLTLWAPHSYPFFITTFFENPTNGAENSSGYYAPLVAFHLDPNTTHSIEAYFFAGDWRDARTAIYDLRKKVTPADMAPLGTLDKPADQTTVNGLAEVHGWVIDDQTGTTVEVIVDGKKVGAAPLDKPRNDIDKIYPNLPGAPNHGFTYMLNTANHQNGSHDLQVRCKDAAGALHILPPGTITITIQN